MNKKDTRRDAWNFDYLGIKAYFKEDNRPEWEKMSDDGMNKFLKFCIFCVFAFFKNHFIIAVIDRFFV